MVSSIPLDGGGVVEVWVLKDGSRGGGDSGDDFISVEIRYQNYHHQPKSSEPKTSTFKLELRSGFDDDYSQYVWVNVWEALDNLVVDSPAWPTAIDAMVRGLSCLLIRRPSHPVMLGVKIEVGMNPNSGEELEAEIKNRKLDLMARWWVLKGERVKKHTKGGKGFARQKLIRMVMVGVESAMAVPMLLWVSPNGKSSRSVIPKKAYLGPSRMFEKNRCSLLGRSDAQIQGCFEW